MCGDNSNHVLTYDHQKVGMEEFGKSRNLCSTIISSNGKIKCNNSFDDMLVEHKQFHVK